MCPWPMLTTAASSRSSRYPDPSFPRGAQPSIPQFTAVLSSSNPCSGSLLLLGLEFPEGLGLLALLFQESSPRI